MPTARRKVPYRAALSDNLLDRNRWSKVGAYTAPQKEDKSELMKLVSSLQPGGPKYNHFWYMKFIHNQLYTCGGAFNFAGHSRYPSRYHPGIEPGQLDHLSG